MYFSSVLALLCAHVLYGKQPSNDAIALFGVYNTSWRRIKIYGVYVSSPTTSWISLRKLFWTILRRTWRCDCDKFVCMFEFSLGMHILCSSRSWRDAVSVHLCDWVSVGLFDASWSFSVDSLTAVMGVIVTSVSSIVHVYSISYMSHDPHLPRFMSYLSFFTFCMLMLITGDNFFVLFLGWEGVGLASYLLINFWFPLWF